MKSAVIYARYSCERQTEQSIEGQLRVCQKYAQDNNLIILNTYIDRAMTGTNDHRPAFQQMLHDCEKNVPWEIVLVYAIDRFGRNSIEIAVNKQKLKKNNKMLISATQRTSENIDGTKNLDGILLENMYIGLAEYYSAELSQKIRRGLLESHNKGQFTGGAVFYGYSLKDKKLSIVPEEEKVIKSIFYLYKNGFIAKEIANYLNDKGFTLRGKPFTDRNILKILHQRKYTGICTYSNIEYNNIFPQIISPEFFDSIQLKIRGNKPGSFCKASPSLLKDLLYCGYCGSKMHVESGTSKLGKTYYYYICPARKSKEKKCNKKRIPKIRFENHIIEIAQSLFNCPENLEIIANEVIRQQEQSNKKNIVLENLIGQRNKAQESLNNVMKAIEMGIINDLTKQRMEELQNEIIRLNARCKEEEAKEIKLSKKEIITFLKKAISREPEKMLHILINSIKITDEKLEITFNYTRKNSPQNDGDCFSYIDENSYKRVSFYMIRPISYLKIDVFAYKRLKNYTLRNKKANEHLNFRCSFSCSLVPQNHIKTFVHICNNYIRLKKRLYTESAYFLDAFLQSKYRR